MASVGLWGSSRLRGVSGLSTGPQRWHSSLFLPSICRAPVSLGCGLSGDGAWVLGYRVHAAVFSLLAFTINSVGTPAQQGGAPRTVREEISWGSGHLSSRREGTRRAGDLTVGRVMSQPSAETTQRCHVSALALACLRRPCTGEWWATFEHRYQTVLE